jgi:hypothetical protein
MVRKFAVESSVPSRALQAYLVLIGAAWNRQILTYGSLSQEQMMFGTGGILSDPLGCIMAWCKEEGLPPLTVLVVNTETGLPGRGLTTVPDEEFAASMQRVFRFNWFDIFPPTLQELQAAWGRLGATEPQVGGFQS